uniref:Uncharacterized protein n=1 Tax=Arundo donax TaxID=35708 RepID=A0A0A9ES52_ARUDO
MIKMKNYKDSIESQWLICLKQKNRPN